MRKTILYLALGAFMATASTTFACDKDKACATSAKSTKAKACCMAKGTKATKACTTKEMKACVAKGDANCSKEMKAAKDTKSCCAKKELKKS